MIDSTPDTIAYIPARLGSLRVAAKNLRLLAGRPLVTYVSETASKASEINEVYMNTESPQIAAAVENLDIGVHMRPEALAENSTTTDEILYEFAKKRPCRRIAVINPTAPFLSVNTIDEAIRLHRENSSSTLFTTTMMHRHLVYENHPVNFRTSGRSPRTQDLSPFEFINFIIFVISREAVIREYEANGYCLYNGSLKFLRMSGLECHDIDEEDDFRIAEAIMAANVNS